MCYDEGDAVYEEGDLGHYFYIVKSGEFVKLREGRNVRTLKKLDYFGERALLLNQLRRSTVKAVLPSEC